MLRKIDLVKLTATASGCQSETVRKVIDAFLNVVGDEIAAGETVRLTGIGTIEAQQRTRRAGLRDFRTGEALPAYTQTAVKFTPSGALKDRLNAR